jgi:hypothetical protein
VAVSVPAARSRLWQIAAGMHQAALAANQPEGAGRTLGGLDIAILRKGARNVVATPFPVDKKVAAFFLGVLMDELAGDHQTDVAWDVAHAVHAARRRSRLYSDLVCHAHDRSPQ